MKNFLSLLALCCFGTLNAQTTVLTEDFDLAIVPPAGWITQNLNSSTTFTEPWNTDVPYGTLRAWHGDGGSADGQAENMLATPAMDLTGMTEAYFHFSENCFPFALGPSRSSDVDVFFELHSTHPVDSNSFMLKLC